MQVVGQPVMKKDAMALVTGKPVFTQDVAPADCLVVKVLRSPHANANILSIKTDAAKKVPGIEAVYTWEDVPTQRFTICLLYTSIAGMIFQTRSKVRTSG